MSRSFLRLDIDHFGIRAMVVEQGVKKRSVTDECRVLFSEVTSEDENQDMFGAAMDMAARKMDLQSCAKAVIFVPAGHVCYRILHLPFRSRKKISQILPFELESFLPGNDHGYVSDFHLLDIPGDENLILSGSIAQTAVESYFTALACFKIQPRVIAPKGSAAAAGFLHQQKDISTFAFVYLAPYEAALVLVNNRIPCAVRTFSPAVRASGDLLADAVRQTIIGFNQRTGVQVAFDVVLCVDETFSQADMVCHALEIKLADQAGLRPVEAGCQKGPAVEIVRPGSLLSDILPDKPVRYLLNFCKGKYGASSFVTTYFSQLAASAVLFVCFLGLVLAHAGIDNAKLQDRIAAIDKKAVSLYMDTFPEKTRVQDPYLQMKANVREAMKNAGTTAGTNPSRDNAEVNVLEIINEISKKIPDGIDVEISGFLFNKGRLVLSGSTDNFNNVDNIKTRLESAALFQKVGISGAATDKQEDKVNFKFNIEL
ncbi:MAG: PilN domain-containing protein [Desulfotignum sp.]